MTRVVASVALCLVVTCVFGVSPASAHPSDSYHPNELDSGYGADWGYGLFAEWGINDISFTQPYPDPSSLTPAERYIVAGATSTATDRPLSKRLHPWWRDICAVAMNYYYQQGRLPTQLDEEMVRATAADSEGVSQAWVDLHRSPITGEFPKLNARMFSPGDVYVRILTEDEIQHFLALLPPLERLYNQHEMLGPQGDWIKAHIVGDIYYVRVYGLHGVIWSNIQYDTVIDEPNFSLQ